MELERLLGFQSKMSRTHSEGPSTRIPSHRLHWLCDIGWTMKHDLRYLFGCGCGQGLSNELDGCQRQLSQWNVIEKVCWQIASYQKSVTKLWVLELVVMILPDCCFLSVGLRRLTFLSLFFPKVDSKPWVGLSVATRRKSAIEHPFMRHACLK